MAVVRFRATYTLQFLPEIPEDLQLPLKIDRQEGRIVVEPREENDEYAAASVECEVDPAGLELRKGQEPLSGSDPYVGIHVPESSALSDYLGRVVDAISFVVDTPIRHSHKASDDVLIPESSDDASLLEDFQTSRVFSPLSARVSIRTFFASEITGEVFKALLGRDLGLSLYHHALMSQDPVASFREYWKLLESAFGTKGDDLVDLLSDYKPAQQLDFTEDELSFLRKLRGRASHGASRTGIEEHRNVIYETSRKLPRLKCLAEQVLLTKRTWGAPTKETERLAEINAYIDSESNPVLIRHH